MASFYPRKQTVIILAICLGVVGACAYYAHEQTPTGEGSETIETSGNIVSSSALASSVIDTDTDWKEQFLDASTSGSYGVAAGQPDQGTEDQPLTATDLLGREFFSKYMEMQQGGLVSDPQTVSNVTSQLVTDGMNDILSPTTYYASDMHVTSATDPATLRAYATEVSAILDKDVPDQNDNEAVIADQALDQSDPSLLAEIDPLIANYRAGIAALLAMPAPEAISSYHLDLVNGMSVALSNAQMLRHVDTDPVSGLKAIGQEITALQEMNDATTAINAYLSAHGSISLD